MFEYTSHHDCHQCLCSGTNDNQCQGEGEVARETFMGKVKLKQDIEKYVGFQKKLQNHTTARIHQRETVSKGKKRVKKLKRTSEKKRNVK